MTPITAVLHTQNDALRLGRCLEMLLPCDEVFIVDHGSQDGTLDLAREYGASVLLAEKYPTPLRYLSELRRIPSRWLLVVDPRESLTESLAASLYEWKSEAAASRRSGAVYLREETAEGWIQVPVAQTRLVPATWERWQGTFPADDREAVILEGELLRFAFP